MTIKYSNTMTDADVRAGITSVSKRSQSVRSHMHNIATSILHGWAKSGDVGTAAHRATEMLAECDGMFSQKIVNWFGKHAGFVLEDEAFVYASKTTMTAAEWKVSCGETMFQFTPDPIAKPFDLNGRIITLVKAAEQRRSKGLTDKDNVDQKVLESLKQLVA